MHDEHKGSAGRLLRLPAVLDKTGLSASAVWRGVREGRFPVPVRIGAQSVAWPELAVDEWITTRPAVVPRSARARQAGGVSL